MPPHSAGAILPPRHPAPAEEEQDGDQHRAGRAGCHAPRASDRSVIWITGVGRGPATDPVPAGRVSFVATYNDQLYALRA